MYGKVFASMYDGSLYGQWEAIVTFQQMIVLCDLAGFIDMTPQAIAARTSIPFEIIAKGIELLEQPDKYSRTPDCDGRRIERIDADRPWGWRVVNHEYYRTLQDADTVREQNRERQRKWRERNGPSRPVTDGNGGSRHAEADTEAIKNLPESRFDEFWKAYPRKVKKADARRCWSRKRLDAKADEILAHLAQRIVSDEQWLDEGGKFIPYPASWLNGDSWEDEYAKAIETKRHYL